MAGNQSRSLILISKAKGWDPTKIEGGESIENFDHDMGTVAGDPLGRLPGGTPDGWPDRLHASVGPPSTPFSTPDVGRETKSRRTNGANPFPAKPGA